jgi:hypothetical protein
MGEHNIILTLYFQERVVFMLMRCPNCSSKDIGKIGSQQFYCWNCFVEMSVTGNELTIHQVESDGSLSSLNDLFTEEERKLEW